MGTKARWLVATAAVVAIAALIQLRDGVLVVAESFTDTAAEVSAAIDDPDAVVFDTAAGWALRVSSADPRAPHDLVDALEVLDQDDWLAAIGTEWGER